MCGYWFWLPSLCGLPVAMLLTVSRRFLINRALLAVIVRIVWPFFFYRRRVPTNMYYVIAIARNLGVPRRTGGRPERDFGVPRFPHVGMYRYYYTRIFSLSLFFRFFQLPPSPLRLLLRGLRRTYTMCVCVCV